MATQKDIKPLSREEFAAALKMHRDRLHITQAEAAEILKISPRVLWKWENEQGDTLFPTQEGTLRILKYAPAKK